MYMQKIISHTIVTSWLVIFSYPSNTFKIILWSITFHTNILSFVKPSVVSVFYSKSTGYLIHEEISRDRIITFRIIRITRDISRIVYRYFQLWRYFYQRLCSYIICLDNNETTLLLVTYKLKQKYTVFFFFF